MRFMGFLIFQVEMTRGKGARSTFMNYFVTICLFNRQGPSGGVYDFKGVLLSGYFVTKKLIQWK